MSGGLATAKLNLALVVGPLREAGRHEVVTVLQRIELADRISIEPADELRVVGFAEDTLVRSALERLAEAAGTTARWAARIRKQIPVAAGLGGGSSDAATALRLANETLPEPLPPDRLHELAAGLGGDAPFFLTARPPARPPARARGRPRARRPLLPDRSPAARHRHGRRAGAAGAAAGLRRRAAAATGRAEAVDRLGLRRFRPPRQRRRVRRAPREAAPGARGR